MTPIADYPRCSAYLKACNYRLDDPSMAAKNWAVCVAEAFTDDELTADGNVDFETMAGDALLGEFERLLQDRRQHRTDFASLESLKAFIGSRGVRVSALESDADYWMVARILWPQAVTKKDGGPLSLLHHKIKSLSKRSRQSARENLHKVPAKWRGVAA